VTVQSIPYEQRTTNNEQRTTNNEQRTTNNEQRTTEMRPAQFHAAEVQWTEGGRTTNNQLVWLVALGLFFTIKGYTQTSLTDTIIGLPLVELKAAPPSNLALGRAVLQLDSIMTVALPNASVSDVLLQTGGAYLKHYGPGRLATAGLRGSSAQQTAILWEGIPVMDPMLGQLDLSLLPTFFFDEVQVYFGGSSIHAGSGAVGGALQMESRMPRKRGLQLGLSTETGQFGHRMGGVKASIRGHGWSSQTKLFYETADNDYDYVTNLGQTRALPNAGLQQHGLLQQLQVHWGDQLLKAQVWYQYADRQLPPTRVQAGSQATQEDEALRTMIQWEKRSRKRQLSLKGAYLQGQLGFTDSLASIFSRSTTHTFVLDARARWLLGTQHQLDIRSQSQWNAVETTAYTDPPTQERYAIIGTYRFLPKRLPWLLQTAFRQEWQDGQASPFLPELKLEYTRRHARFFAHASRTYRWPTLNDLFWEPGGNAGLVPEQGWSQEVGGEWAFRQPGIQVTANASAFAQQLEERIIWLPEGAFFSPVNVQSVNTFGLAPRLAAAIKRQQWAVTMQLGYDWTRTVNAASRIPNDRSVGRQLIYVPRHQGFTRVHVNYRGWVLQYQHQWIGRVFTLGDHSQSIPRFQLGFLSLAKGWQWRNQHIHAYLQLRNLWDTDYEFVIQRPMPGRHVRIGLNYQFQTKV
jgi:vitamin B12 transporter